MRPVYAFLGAQVLLLVATALVSCSGPGWGRAAEAGVDVAECTIDALIARARREGNESLAAQLQQVKMREVAP